MDTLQQHALTHTDFTYPAISPLEPRRRASVPASARGEALRVLVVDSDYDSVNQFAGWLRSRLSNLCVAYDKHSALRAAAYQHPHLVLLNLEMSYDEGCGVAKRLQHGFPENDCFIIATTWRKDAERRQESIEAGVGLLLVRPIELSTVETLLLLESERAETARR